MTTPAPAPARHTPDGARLSVTRLLTMLADYKTPGLYECPTCDVIREAAAGGMCPDCSEDAATAASLAAAAVEVASAETPEAILGILNELLLADTRSDAQ